MHIMAKFLVKFYSQVGTPLAGQAKDLAIAGKWTELQELQVGCPSTYQDPEVLKKDLMVVDIFRKCRLPADTERLYSKAVETFWASETQCLKTNARLHRYNEKTLFLRDSSDVAVHAFIMRWRKEVKRVLGRVSYNLTPRFSGGSTLSDKGMQTTIPDKMTSVPTCYPHSLELACEAYARTPQLERSQHKIVRANKFFTVPKDSFKDRGCCVEASSNVGLQLAVGALLKRRFREAYKVDMASLPLRHQRLALLGSAGRRKVATIDLSNASDTISKGLIDLILPVPWLQLLNSLRATHTKIDGKVVYLEKYSSMGNGFTFELETILFRTLCDTVIGRRLSSSFGDDMIVPEDWSEAVMAALKFFGFTPNKKKTFCDGPFRESCGGNYHSGKSVWTYQIKELPDEPQHWIAIANGLRRMDPSGAITSSAWHYCLDQLPINIRSCRGPAWLGDLVITDPEHKPTLRSYSTRTNGRDYTNSPAYFFKVYRPVQRTFDLGKHFFYRQATAAASLGTPSEVAPRDAVAGHKIDYVAAYGRADFFGWLGE